MRRHEGIFIMLQDWTSQCQAAYCTGDPVTNCQELNWNKNCVMLTDRVINIRRFVQTATILHSTKFIPIGIGIPSWILNSGWNWGSHSSGMPRYIAVSLTFVVQHQPYIYRWNQTWNWIFNLTYLTLYIPAVSQFHVLQLYSWYSITMGMHHVWGCWSGCKNCDLFMAFSWNCVMKLVNKRSTMKTWWTCSFYNLFSCAWELQGSFIFMH